MCVCVHAIHVPLWLKSALLSCRRDVECDLTFCGLLVMENRLKPETGPTLKILQDANIRTVMITGGGVQYIYMYSTIIGEISYNTHTVLW